MAKVAERAGVSHQTVSRVINGFPGVRPQVRERVEKAIEELGYRHNNAARTLVTCRSGLIGVIAIGSFLYGPTSTLASIEEAARSRKYTTLLATIREENKQQFDDAIGVCLDRAVEVIIIIAAQENVVRYVTTLKVDVPMIVVGPGPTDLPSLSTLSVDQEEGARAAIRHLVELGHEKVLILSGPNNWLDAEQRLKGALAECESSGVEAEVVEGDWSPACGHNLGHVIALRSNEERPTAVFAANDSMALGVLLALNQAGVSVPEEISIVGFDDIPEAEFFSPPLTTVRQDFTSLGPKVVAAAMAKVNNEEPDMMPVPPTLSVRGSTARPRFIACPIHHEGLVDLM
jgi:DNA-binding LacI/PurR family transcriptional regulator